MVRPDADAWRQVSAVIRRGETLLWAGRPARGLRFRASDPLMILLGLFFGAFGSVFCWAAFRVADAYAIVLSLTLGAGFLMWGLFLTVGWYFVDAHARTNAVYGLTGQRVLIVSNDKLAEWASLGAITHLSLTQRRNREGNIHIVTDIVVRRGEDDCKLTLSFGFIPDAARVYGLIQDAKAKYRPQDPSLGAVPSVPSCRPKSPQVEG